MKFTQIAILSAATLAVAEHHNHAHHHARRGSPIEARNPVVTVVQPPVQTVYMLDGKPISQKDVEAGVNSGKYYLDNNKVVPIAASTLAPAPSQSAAAPSGGEFLQKPSPKPSSSQEAPKPSSEAPKPSSTPSTGSDSGNGDTSKEFPSGTIPCSQFPSDYGAVRTDWLNLGGWTGIQHTPDYKVGDSSISNIVGTSGCNANTFCSYACPPGYQKSQWPSAQGATGQSIGGLFCNSNSMLELSRSSSKNICEQGAGGVSVTNKLGQAVAMCRTDYPGSESETVPLLVNPGQTQPVTNPDSSNYYVWEGKQTTAQYYINPAGTTVSDACQWGSAGTNIGNWAPVNVGVGKNNGATFIGLFPNAPTNPDGKLNFNVAITGGVTAKCEYKNGQYYTNGNATPSGCTTGTTGPVTFEFS